MVDNIFVVMPAYNAGATIEKVFSRIPERVKKRIGRYVIVNDGSKDNMEEALLRLSADHSNLIILRHEINRGYGAAEKTLLDYALNEGPCPEEIINYTAGYSGIKYLSIYAQAAFEALGNILIRTHEVLPSVPQEFEIREAINEIFKNDPNMVWLNMPANYPSQTNYTPGPFLSPGDFRIFPGKHLVIGIGVADPSHIKDQTKSRSSGDELGAEVVRRMLEPFGWKVDNVYFDSKLSYHIDCVMALIDEGLIFHKRRNIIDRYEEILSDKVDNSSRLKSYTISRHCFFNVDSSTASCYPARSLKLLPILDKKLIC